jgi:hypothetical protein
MIVCSGRPGRRAWWRKAAAMLVSPASRKMVMARFNLAITRGRCRGRTPAAGLRARDGGQHRQQPLTVAAQGVRCGEQLANRRVGQG